MLIAGFVTTGVVRGVSVGLFVLLISLFFTHLVVYNAFVVVAFLVLTSLIFSLAGLVNGVYATSIDGINIVPTFVLTPLVYLGGVFYSAATLPGAWGTLTKFDPIFYLVNGFRYGFLGVADVSIWFSAALLSSFVLILLAINWYLLKTGLGLRS